MQRLVEFQPAPHTDYIFDVVGFDWPHRLALGLAVAFVFGAGVWLRRRRSKR